MVCTPGLLVAISYNLRPSRKISGPVNPNKALRAGLPFIQDDLSVGFIAMLVGIDENQV